MTSILFVPGLPSTSLHQRQYLFELIGSRPLEQFKHYHLGGGDDGAMLPHSLQADSPVFLGAGGNGIAHHVDRIVRQGMERGLGDTDMGFDAGQDYCLPVQPLKPLREGLT